MDSKVTDVKDTFSNRFRQAFQDIALSQAQFPGSFLNSREGEQHSRLKTKNKQLTIKITMKSITCMGTMIKKDSKLIHRHNDGSIRH
jgi:hypothetical protein